MMNHIVNGPNEKVALEVTIGASIAGSRSMAVMKHVGLNVAADTMFALAYTGVNGGLIIISADDKECTAPKITGQSLLRKICKNSHVGT